MSAILKQAKQNSPFAALARQTTQVLLELNLDCKIVIIAERPTIFLSALRKYWLFIGRKLQRERASTFDQTKSTALTKSISYIYTTKFSAANKLWADILITDDVKMISNYKNGYVFICSNEQKQAAIKYAQNSRVDFIVLT